MSGDTAANGDRFKELLARWQAFSELQQRAFAFLASEAIAAGAAFEDSTSGATQVLMRLAERKASGAPNDVQADVWAIVHKLQSADRSRQGLEQVASVLTTLRDQHAELVAESATSDLPDVDGMTRQWIEAMETKVTLSDWRRRLIDALHGRPPVEIVVADDEDELF